MAKLRCVFKTPRGPAHLGEIPDKLKDYQFFVDGYVQAVNLSCGAVLLCNEEGKHNGMELNFYLRSRQSGNLWDYVCGPVVILGTEKGEFASIDEELGKEICQKLNAFPSLEVG